MIKSIKTLVAFAVLIGMVMWLMPKVVPASNLASLDSEFKALAIKMTVARLLVIGTVGLLLWPQLSGWVKRYFSVDISRLQGRVLCWYIAIEAAILGSFWGGF